MVLSCVSCMITTSKHLLLYENNLNSELYEFLKFLRTSIALFPKPAFVAVEALSILVIK